VPRKEARTGPTAGFTLVEAIVAAGLTALVAGFGTLVLPDLVRGLRVAGATRELAAVLRLARGRALAQGAAVEVEFDVPGATVIVRAPGGAPLEERRLPDGVVFIGVPARGRIRFGALGTADNGTLLVGAGQARGRVVVNQRGRVRVT
jgi:Tfp pilus assembly protein FimT